MSGQPFWATADEKMGACAAVSKTCVAPCGAITCILRQSVHNKDDQNKDDYNEEDHN